MKMEMILRLNISKNKIGILLMLPCSLCACLGSLVWKIMPGYHLIYLLGGFAIYFLGSCLMILAYRYGELSVLQPLNSMSYVFTAVIAVLILHEAIPLKNIIGIVLVVGGVFVIGLNST